MENKKQDQLIRLEQHCNLVGLNPDKYVQMLEDDICIVTIVDQIADDLLKKKELAR